VGQTITVYSGQHQQTASALAAGFTTATGIKVELRSGDEAELANQLLQEGSATPADVFYAENPPALQALAEKNLLALVDPATLAKVPGERKSPQGRWVGVSARSVALAYNTNAGLSDAGLPASVLDMATPAWKGRLGFAPTETDFQPVLTAVVKLKGPDAPNRWLAGLKANAKVYSDNEALVAAVNSGEVATGLLDHYYWYRLHQELGDKTTSALHYFGPGDPGSLVDVSGAAVLASSKHAVAAQKFLAYLVDKPAQTIIATSDSYEYPLGSGVSTAQPLRPLPQLQPPGLTVDDLGDGRASLVLLQQNGML
jgi:iron(III) transport system substrate-binding protein